VEAGVGGYKNELQKVKIDKLRKDREGNLGGLEN
jgi:hypothetical protein